jgi:5-methylcytosine-specific restriction protein A
VLAAKRMLARKPKGSQRGLETLLEANRPELTYETLVLERRFSKFFTAEEKQEAERRLSGYRRQAKRRLRLPPRLFPDEVEPGRTFPEGAKKTVRVNAYERNAAARKACIDHHGCRCSVCDLDFATRYGEIGEGFIHVHHLRQLSTLSGSYRVDPINDLIPVCPNCHAMLHRADDVSWQDLRSRIRESPV